MGGSLKSYELQGFRDRWEHVWFDRTVIDVRGYNADDEDDDLSSEDLGEADRELSFVDTALARWMNRNEVSAVVHLDADDKGGRTPCFSAEVSLHREQARTCATWYSRGSAQTSFRSPIVAALHDVAADYISLKPTLTSGFDGRHDADWSKVIGLEAMRELAHLLYDIRVVDGVPWRVERYDQDGRIKSRERLAADWKEDEEEAAEATTEASEGDAAPEKEVAHA